MAEMQNSYFEDRVEVGLDRQRRLRVFRALAVVPVSVGMIAASVGQQTFEAFGANSTSATRIVIGMSIGASFVAFLAGTYTVFRSGDRLKVDR